MKLNVFSAYFCRKYTELTKKLGFKEWGNLNRIANIEGIDKDLLILGSSYSRLRHEKEVSILFDMDGTLIDSSAAMTHSVNYVRNTLGLAPIAKEFLEYHINQPDQHLPKIFIIQEYDPSHRALFKEHYMHFSPSMIALYPHVRELLECLSEKAYFGNCDQCRC